VRGTQNGCLLYLLDVMIAKHNRRRRDDDDDDNDGNHHHPMAVGLANEFLFRLWFICLSLLTVKLV
jgi:hypothetical protein